MSLDTSFFEKENLPNSLDNLPLDKSLAGINFNMPKFQELSNLLSQEGEWCKLVTRGSRNFTSSICVAQFQLGKKGLFISKDKDGNKSLKIDVLKKPNWSFNGKHEGFVLYNNEDFSVEPSISFPVNYFNSSSRVRSPSFSTQNQTIHSRRSNIVTSFTIGEFDSTRGYGVLRDYATTRTNSIPFEVSLDPIEDDAMFMALLSYQNSLFNQGKLDEKVQSIGNYYHGITLESIASSGFDFKKAKVFDSSSLFYQEMEKLDESERELKSHVELAKQEFIRVRSIKKVSREIRDENSLGSSGAGNGFNGVSDYFSGHIREFRKGKEIYSQIPSTMTIITNPLDPQEVWVKPHDIGGRKRAMVVYDKFNGKIK